MELQQRHRHLLAAGTGLLSQVTLVALHGTGGNETSLLTLAQEVLPGATVLSPRGNVSEHGAARFFRRLAEGIFDEEDLMQRTRFLADFLRDAAAVYNLDAQRLFAFGYSNGANMAASLMLLRPEVLAGAVLIRPMLPLVPEAPPQLAGRAVLVLAGRRDTICPPPRAQALAELLGSCGAAVRTEWLNAGHELTSNDVESARAWLEGHALPDDPVPRG